MDLSLRKFRKNIAAFSVLALIASFLVIGTANAAVATDVYGDVDGTEWYAADVQWGLDSGVLNETQAYFRGGDNASRAEFFKMTAAGAGIPEAACDETLFPDLDADHWGCGWVTALAEAGIVSGDGASSATPGHVRPNDNVLRAEAAKVVVEGYGLVGTTPGTVFNDVDGSEWYSDYAGIANENCVFRGVGSTMNLEPGRNIVRAEAIAVVNRGANPTTDCTVVVPADGALTVALDGSSPAGVDIPNNGANIPYSVFAFSADAGGEDVNVDQLIISREGLGLPGDFTNLKLYVNGVQKGGEKTVNTTTNTATFNLTSDPIVVPAGSTVLVEVRGDMSGADNSQNQLCIAMADDVLAMGASSDAALPVGGSFEICGDYMSTTSASVGTLTYSVSQPSTADINVGDVDVIMTKVRMDMATEDVEIERVTFKQTGSAGPEDFGNISLWSSGSLLVDSGVASWEGDFLTFDLSASPLTIAKGNSRTLELHTDVVGGLASSTAFDIYRDWHIEGTGVVYGYGVNVVECLGACSPLSAAPTTRSIIGGNVAFSLSSNNPVTGDVKKGANDHEFGKFNISTGGDGVSVRKIGLTVTSTGVDVTLANIDDVKIWTQNSVGDWFVVAGPNDFTALTNPETVTFTDSFDVPAATTQEFMVTGDVANAATAGDTYNVDVADVTNAGNSELEYLSDGTPLNVTTEVTGGLLDGNVFTVNTPSLNIGLSATPGDKTYVRNTLDKDLVAFDLSASTADDIRVTGLVVSCADTDEAVTTPNDTVDDDGDLVADEGDGVDNDGDGTADNGSAPSDPERGTCSTAFQSLKLYEKDGSTLTLVDNQTRTMSDAGNGEGTVTFSTNYTVPAGSTARLLVRSNLASGAIQDGYQFHVQNVASHLTAEDTDSAAATITGLATAVRTVVVANSGLMTNQGITDAILQARIISGGSTDEPVMKVKFAASELEAWIVQDLQFDVDSMCDGNLDGALDICADPDFSNIIVKYLDQAGDPQEVSGVISAGTVTFNNLGAYVPADGNQTLDIELDMGVVTSGGATTGDVFQLLFNGAGTFEAVGASSAAQVLTAVSVTSNPQRIAKSFPIVTSNDNISSVMSTNSELYSVTIAADAAGPIGVKQLCFDVVNNGGGAYTPATAKLYREGEATDLVTAGEVTLTEAGALCGATGTGVLVQWHNGAVGGEDEVGLSASKTYVLRGAVTGAAAGDKVTTVLIGDNTATIDAGAIPGAATPYVVGATAENFVWSDKSGSPHLTDELAGPTSADFLDGYLVQGLSSVTAHEVSF